MADATPDYSNSPLTPTQVTWTEDGSGFRSTVSNAVGGSDPKDYVTFTVPVGQRLTSFELSSYSSSDGVAFIALQPGSIVTGSEGNTTPFSGYAHFGSASSFKVGTNWISALGGPLAAGSYSAWIQQLGAVADYSFSLGTTAVELPPQVRVYAQEEQVNEGQTATFLIETQNVPTGTLLAYSMTGVDANDVVGGTLEGSLKLSDNGKGSIKVTLVADAKTEGDELLKLAVAGQAASTIVIDRSIGLTNTLNPPPSYELQALTSSVKEGETARFLLKTTHLPPHAFVAYQISNWGAVDPKKTTAADFASGSLIGVVQLDASGTGVIEVPIAADTELEWDEMLKVLVRDASSTSLIIDKQAETSSGIMSVEAGREASNEYLGSWFKVVTTGIPKNAMLTYMLSGIDASDLDLSSNGQLVAKDPLVGFVTIGDDGTGYVNVPFNQDKKTEGSETLTVTIRGIERSVTIFDTSRDLPSGTSSDVAGFSLDKYFQLLEGALLPSFQQATLGETIPGVYGDIKATGRKFVGDFNGDGLDDFIVTYGDVLMPPLLYLSRGDGTFAQGAALPHQAARRLIRNGKVIDLDGDGDLDFVGFTAPHPFYEEKLGPTWDIDEPDLVLLNNGNATFHVVDGLLESYHHGGGLGDLNGDGLLDIVGITENRLWGRDPHSLPLLQVSPGKFQYASNGLGIVFPNAQISDLRLADLNLDGFLDVVLGYEAFNHTKSIVDYFSKNSTLVIGYGAGSLDFSTFRWESIGTYWMNGSDWERYLMGFETRPSGTLKEYGGGVSHLEVIDVNNDGRLDILEGQYVSGPTNWSTSGFKYYENTPSGFIDKTDQIFPNQLANRSVSDVTTFFFGFEFADLNNDGMKDLVLSHLDSDRLEREEPWSISVRLNVDGVFQPAVTQTLLGNDFWPLRSQYVTGDFNGDGYTDLLSISGGQSVVTLLNKGTGLELQAGPSDSVLEGRVGKDSLLGGLGRDRLRGAAGSDKLDGGDGLDTAVFEKARSAYKAERLVQDGATLWKVTDLATGDVDELRNIEKLEFAKANVSGYNNPVQTEVSLDLTGTPSVTYRIYRAAFARDPDLGGLGYWLSEMEKYLDPSLSPEQNPYLLAVAKTFVESDEFKNKYGKDVGNDVYVLNLYLNALGRDPRVPDAQGKLDAGYPYWVDVLNKSYASRSDLFVYFSESAENKAAVAQVIATGIEYVPWQPPGT